MDDGDNGDERHDVPSQLPFGHLLDDDGDECHDAPSLDADQNMVIDDFP
jgi:hypothetical protein